MRNHLACIAVVAALGAVVLCLLPAAVVADWSYPAPIDRPAIVRTQRWLWWVIQPPNAAGQALGLEHLEYQHLMDPQIFSGSSPAHDMTGCACSPAEMRRAFFLVAWPFWFLVLFAAGALALSIAKRVSGRRGI
jgi:hypothetical protein